MTLNKIRHQVNLKESTRVDLVTETPDDCSNCGHRKRIKFIQSGIRSRACKRGLEDMATLPTALHVYARPEHAMFLYRCLWKKHLHPYELSNGIMNDLAAGNPLMFYDFFIVGIFTIFGWPEYSSLWLEVKDGN